jgi:hypothetical protein
MKKKQLTEEHKRKIRETMRSPELRKLMSEIHKGKTISEKQKREISKSSKGKKIPKWHRERMSGACMGEKNYMYDRNVKGIESCRFLVRYLGIADTCILLDIARKIGNYNLYIPRLSHALRSISDTKERKGLFMIAIDYVNPALLLGLCILFPSEQWWLPQCSPWERIFKG